MLKLARVHRFSGSSGSGGLEPVELLFALARRTQQAFSVVCIEIRPIDPHPDLGSVELAIAADLRRTDVLARCDRAGHYAVFCPATDAQGAKELIQRLWSIASPMSIRGGVSTFPHDALVLEELIARALTDARDAQDHEARLQQRAGIGSGRAPRPDRVTLDPRQARSAGAKRAFDLIFSALSAPVWLPTLMLVALAIKCSDPRAPVLFPQMRTGRGATRFRMYKFRTMVPNAEDLKERYAHLNELAWPDFKIGNDPRTTRLGRFLRKTSLDELPQVLNVLRGEMSWVGPRPTSFGPETYELWQTARLDVVPGVTGLWQVVGRGHTNMHERLRLDMEYIDRRSLWFDLKLLLLTVREVIRPRGGS
jgi:lipopolysaccharide/colanic/teichoic acid biosynthesis glycosyltransferase